MRSAVALAAFLLVACQNSALGEALIEKAQESAHLPDCASLRFIWARQYHVPNEGNVVAIYHASSQCMDDWEAKLDRSDWDAEHHGGWTSPDGKVFAAPYRGGLVNEGLVMWWQDEFEPGVPDITKELGR